MTILQEFPDLIRKPQLARKYNLFLSIDAEWSSEFGPISVQIFDTSSGKTTVYFDNKVRDLLGGDIVMDSTTNDNTEILYISFEDEVNIIDDLYIPQNFQEILKSKKVFDVEILCYFSPKDLWLAFGYKNIKPFFEKQKVNFNSQFIPQNSNMMGNFNFQHNYRLIDLYGWNSGQKGGLLNLAGSLNIEMSNKKIFDDCKDKMHRPLRECPLDFVRYAAFDAKVLVKVYFEKILQHNKMIKEILGLHYEFRILRSEFPTTCGSLVNKTFSRVLYNFSKKEDRNLHSLFISLAF